MDIFTTVLTKVRSTPIKPKKLRVKALKKEPETHELTDDLNHLEDHDLYFIKEKKYGEGETHPEKESNADKSTRESSGRGIHAREGIEEDISADNIIPSESVITDKQEILHPHKANEEPEEDIKHLDIFV
ncbi:hypothetical protein AADZ91_10465 [Colwelliaceae bacterium 6441]